MCVLGLFSYYRVNTGGVVYAPLRIIYICMCPRSNFFMEAAIVEFCSGGVVYASIGNGWPWSNLFFKFLVVGVMITKCFGNNFIREAPFKRDFIFCP